MTETENCCDQSEFGFSVSLTGSGELIAIGERDWKNPDHKYTEAGRTHLYNLCNTSASYLLAIDGESFGIQSGYATALVKDGSGIAIGEPRFPWSGNIRFRGRVRYYELQL